MIEARHALGRSENVNKFTLEELRKSNDDKKFIIADTKKKYDELFNKFMGYRFQVENYFPDLEELVEERKYLKSVLEEAEKREKTMKEQCEKLLKDADSKKPEREMEIWQEMEDDDFDAIVRIKSHRPFLSIELEEKILN